MDSLQNILGSRDFSPPTEIELIREYVERRYKAKCHIQLQRNSVILSVKSASLASTLRLDQQRIIEACKLTKRLIVRIG